MDDIIKVETKWVIISKDRKVVACGVPRSRYLEKIDETTKRILTYKSKGMAEAGFKSSFFYQYTLGLDKKYTKNDLESVQVEITYKVNYLDASIRGICT